MSLTWGGTNKNVMIIDAVAASDLLASGSQTMWWSPKLIRWVGATTAGHKCSVRDAAGNIIWESTADGDKFNDQTTLPKADYKGLTVPTLGSGTVYIYLN